MNFSLANKNKQRQIRKKTVTTIDDKDENNNNENNNSGKITNENKDAEEDEKVIIKPIINNKKKNTSNTFSTKQSKATTSTKKSLNLFSFGDDDDGDENNEFEKQQDEDNSKSFSGMKFNPTLSIKRNDSLFEDSKATTLKNESLGQYTTEMLNNLKKNTSTKPNTKTSTSIKIDDIDHDKMEIDHEKFNDNDNDNESEIYKKSSIMVASVEQIKLAKEKRQRARDGKWQDTNEKSSSSSTSSTTSRSLSKDFLPLKVSENKNDNVNEESTSRIIREEDDDELEEEYNINTNSNTIKFGDPGKSNKRDDVIQAINKDKSNDSEQEDEEDEEITRWRLEQIKKGGGLKDLNILQQQQLQSSEFQRKKFEKELLLMSPSETYKSSSSLVNNPKLSSTTTSTGASTAGTSFIESLCKDLNNILINLNEVKHNHQSEFEKVQEALRDSVISLSVMESEQHMSHDQLIFYDELKIYCNNMIDCLGEKIPEIEDLEDRYYELLKDYAHDTRKQFKTQLHDHIYDIQENESSSSSSSSSHMIIKSIINDKQQDSEIDEFGRDKSLHEKFSRKKRLEQYKEMNKSINDNQDDDDDNDDKEWSLYSESDENYFKEDKLKILESIKSVMSDVDPEYCDIEMISQKFKHWRSKDLKSYQKSQMSSIMPSVFAPFVRLQMIEWSPLSNIMFDSFNWYKHLFTFTDNDDNNNNNQVSNNNNEDDDIIPRLVEKIIIPKVEMFATYIWNPFSIKQTLNLKNTVDEILIYTDSDGSGGGSGSGSGKENEDIKFLFSQILSTLKYSIENNNLIIPYSTRDLTFSIKMFNHALTLLNSIKIWSTNFQYIQLDSLMNLSDEIINLHILPWLHKIYSSPSTNTTTKDLFYLFESFYQYLMSLPWSNKKYKNSICSLLNEILSNQENGKIIILQNENLEKLKNIYLPYFS